MALGLTRRTRAHPVDLENLAYAAHEFREALIPLHGITPDRCDTAATELRNRAHHAQERFFAAVAGLPRRERALARHWENAAVMRYRHGLEAFARAEDLGADMLAPLINTNGPTCSGQYPAGPADGFAPPPSTRPGDDHDRATERFCIVDQAELRWRIRRDLTSLLFENAIAGDGISRAAERHLVPWLKLACETLDSPMSLDGPGDVGVQWRERRQALPARRRRSGRRDHRRSAPPSTRLWRKLVHGDEPPPPL